MQNNNKMQIGIVRKLVLFTPLGDFLNNSVAVCMGQNRNAISLGRTVNSSQLTINSFVSVNIRI